MLFFAVEKDTRELHLDRPGYWPKPRSYRGLGGGQATREDVGIPSPNVCFQRHSHRPNYRRWGEQPDELVPGLSAARNVCGLKELVDLV